MASPHFNWGQVPLKTTGGGDAGSNVEKRDDDSSHFPWCPWSSPTVVKSSAALGGQFDGQAWQQLVKQMEQACTNGTLETAGRERTTLADSTVCSSTSSAWTGPSDSPKDCSSSSSSSSVTGNNTTPPFSLSSEELVSRLLGLDSKRCASKTSHQEIKEDRFQQQQQQHVGSGDGLQFMSLPRRSPQQEDNWRQQHIEQQEKLQQVADAASKERKRQATAVLELLLSGAGGIEAHRNGCWEQQEPAKQQQQQEQQEQQQQPTAEDLQPMLTALIENLCEAQEQQQQPPQAETLLMLSRSSAWESISSPYRKLRGQPLLCEQKERQPFSESSEKRSSLDYQPLNQQATPQRKRLMQKVFATQEKTVVAQDWLERQKPMLLLVLHTLYADQILPSGFNLKGRLLENGCSNQLATNFMECYRRMTDTCRVEPYSFGEEVVCLVNPPPNHAGWIDANDPEDPYPEEMWDKFLHFVEALALSDCRKLDLGGGRYGMARFLHKRHFPFLSNYSLGQLCHIVQLAISSKKVLTYEDNILKPVNQCKKVIKAFLRLPERHTGKNHISSIPELQLCILELLRGSPGGLTLSTLKRKIKLKFGKELSQTVFSCTKLSDLMQLPDIRSVCAVVKKARHIKLVPVRIQNNFEASPSPPLMPPLLPCGIDWTGPDTQRATASEFVSINFPDSFSRSSQAFCRNSNSAAWLQTDWGEKALDYTMEKVRKLSISVPGSEPLSTTELLADGWDDKKSAATQQKPETNTWGSDRSDQTSVYFAEASAATLTDEALRAY